VLPAALRPEPPALVPVLPQGRPAERLPVASVDVQLPWSKK
jgi:hypothetical protein